MRFIPKPVRNKLKPLVRRIFPEQYDRRRVRRLYDHLAARAFETAEVPFLNYGFVPLTKEQSQAVSSVPQQNDLCDQYSIQLYEYVLSPVDLKGKEVLEVGCGRGGGCRWIKVGHGAGRVVGLDLSTHNISVCRREYDESGLSFELGDAHDLPFPDRSFDAVVNVESSHCYTHIDRFFGETCRVLRDDGDFLFADLRPRRHVTALLHQAQDAGFRIVREVDITANVTESLRLHSKRREEVYWKHYGDKGDFKSFSEFARLKGSEGFRQLDHGDVKYLALHLCKTER